MLLFTAIARSSRLYFLSIWLLLAVFSVASAQEARIVPGGKFGETVYRSADGKLYAIEFDYDGLYQSNHLLSVINPLTAAVEQQWPFPQPVNRIRLSSDQSMLYCIAEDSIYRYNFTKRQFDLRIGIVYNGYKEIREVIPLPDKPDAILVAWILGSGQTPNHSIRLYDSDLQRPMTLNMTSFPRIDTDGKLAIVQDYSSSGHTIAVATITPAGLTLLPDKYTYGYKGISYFDGRFYTEGGYVLDIDAKGKIKQSGTIRLQRDLSFIMPYLPGKDTIYVHTTAGDKLYLRKFHRNNFQLLSEEFLFKTPEDFKQLSPEQLSIKSVTPLGNPYQLAIKSKGLLYIVSPPCKSQIKSVPDLDKAVYYGCGYKDSLKITAPGNFSANQYFWSYDLRGKTIALKISPYSTFLISYRVADAAGCLSAPSKPAQVQFIEQPRPPKIVPEQDGYTTLCKGGFLTLTANVAEEQRAFDYEWSNGATTKTVRITTPDTPSCRVRAKNGCWSEPTVLASFIVSKMPHPPTPQITILNGTQSEIICGKDSVRLQGPSGYRHYIWSNGYGGFMNPVWSVPAKNGPVWLQVVNEADCLSERSSVLDLQTYARPPKPSIVQSGALLASSAETGNQWFVDNIPISGATSQYFTAAQSGAYTVQVTAAPGCSSEVSAPVAVKL